MTTAQVNNFSAVPPSAMVHGKVITLNYFNLRLVQPQPGGKSLKSGKEISIIIEIRKGKNCQLFASETSLASYCQRFWNKKSRPQNWNISTTFHLTLHIHRSCSDLVSSATGIIPTVIRLYTMDDQLSNSAFQLHLVLVAGLNDHPSFSPLNRGIRLGDLTA